MEYFDIVDENGVPTGETVERRAAHTAGIRHRTAHVWVIRTRGGKTQVLLQKRSLNKDSHPGRLDTSSAGHIPAGCGPAASAVRELREELGIAAAEKELAYIGRFSVEYEEVFHGAPFHDNEVSSVYVLAREIADDEIAVQKEELESADWYDFAETVRAVERHDERYCVPEGSIALLKKWLE